MTLAEVHVKPQNSGTKIHLPNRYPLSQQTLFIQFIYFLFSLYTCTRKIPEYCHKQHSHHSRVLHQYILFVHSAATSTTRLSPYKHLKSILEHSWSLQHNYFGSIVAELAERSPIIIQNRSNPSSRKNLDVRPYDRTRCYF